MNNSGFPSWTHVPKNSVRKLPLRHARTNNRRILTTPQSLFDRVKYTEVRYDTHHLSSADGLA